MRVAEVETRVGPGVLDPLAAELDTLHAATGTPLTGRGPWLQAWSSAYPHSEPWAVLVRDPDTGRLDAVALLCRREVTGGTDVSPLGFGRNDRSHLPALTFQAAASLAQAVATELEALDVPWTLRIEQATASDPVVAELAERLPVAVLVPGGDVPCVRRTSDGTSVDAYLSKSLRKVLRKSRNRLDLDGLAAHVALSREPAEVAALIDEVERAHRARDHAVQRESDLDTDGGLRFWRRTILAHAVLGQVEIATLRLAGALAAYVVSFLDGDCFRVFDGRFATEWARYSPGRLLETEVLGRVLADDRFAVLDWMNSVAPDKLVCANGAEQTQHLVACSPDRQRHPELRPDEVVLRDAGHQPTAHQALRALAGVGRAAARRARSRPR